MPAMGYGAWRLPSTLTAPQFYLPLAINRANEKAASTGGLFPKPRLASMIT